MASNASAAASAFNVAVYYCKEENDQHEWNVERPSRAIAAGRRLEHLTTPLFFLVGAHPSGDLYPFSSC